MARKFMTSVMAAAAMMSMVPAMASAADVRPGDSLVSAQAASTAPVAGVQRQGATLEESNKVDPATLLGIILTIVFTTTGTILFVSESP
jgi:hypothetical protein